MLFADQKGWFVGIDSGVNIFWRETYAIMHVKPMGVDPVFWEILNMPENKSAPLSFRALGAWACKPVEFARSSIDECDMNPAATAHGIVEWADRELARAYGELTIDGFIARLVAAPEQIQNGRLTSTIVATLLMAGREDEAEAACVAAIDRGSSGSFFTGAGTFPEVALKHIQACRALRALH
jgi:hypothetical protein